MPFTRDLRPFAHGPSPDFGAGERLGPVRDADTGASFVDAGAGIPSADLARLLEPWSDASEPPGSVERGFVDVYEEWLAATKVAYTHSG